MWLIENEQTKTAKKRNAQNQQTYAKHYSYYYYYVNHVTRWTIVLNNDLLLYNQNAH